MARILALIFAALVSVSAWAADCPVISGITWDTNRTPVPNSWEADTVSGTRCGVSVGTSTGTDQGGKASAADAQSAWEASRPSNRQWPEVMRCEYHSGAFYGYIVVYQMPGNNGSSGKIATWVKANTTAATCTIPTDEAECEADAWIHSEVAADTAAQAEASVAVGDCVEGCTVKAVERWSPGINLGSGLRWSLGIQISGESCGAEPVTPSPQEPEGPGEKELCKSTPGGGTACAGPFGENCGYLNGKFVCLGKTDPDECWVNDDGSKWCGEGAPLPPAPDNGTRGEKATPDDTVSEESPDGTTTVYQYFNTTTVGNASNPSDSGANPNRPGSADPATEPTPGTCEGDNCGGEGGGSEEGGASWCDAPPTCSDAGSIYCAQLQQQWRAMCPLEPMPQEALDAIGATEEEINGVAETDAVDIGSLDAVGPLGAASCPAPISITVMGQSLSLDIWQRGCDMALLFAPFVMAMGYLMAGLLFLRGLN